MSKSRPTIDQKRANAAFDGSGRSMSDVTPSEKAIGPSENLTRYIWKLPNDYLDRLLSDVFGRERIRSFALAMEPARLFKTNFQLIDTVKRKRSKGTRGFTRGVKTVIERWEYSNQIVDDPDPQPEYLVGSSVEVNDNSGFETFTEFFEDSTDKLRKKGTRLSEMRQCKTTLDWKNDNLLSYVVNSDIKMRDAPPSPFYTREVTRTTFYYAVDQPVVAPVDNWGNDNGAELLEESVKYWCYDNLAAILTPVLTSARQYNAFYQLGELKDLPKLLVKTKSLYNYLRGAIKDPLAALQKADKRLGDAILTKEFGWDSVVDAAADTLRAPKKIAKRLNYLLERNGKRTTQRYKRTFKNPFNVEYFYPYYTYFMPSTVDYWIIEEEQSLVPKLETRTVVNTVVNFPKVVVPEFSDSNYRDLTGLNPTITDIYNLYPYSWLNDWFTGVGDYLELIQTVINDKDLVNYGMITAILNCEWSIKGKLGIRDIRVDFDSEGNLYDLEEGDVVEIPYNFSSSIRYRTRFDIASLDNVKSVDNRFDTLSESQKSILGALIAKFTK